MNAPQIDPVLYFFISYSRDHDGNLSAGDPVEMPDASMAIESAKIIAMYKDGAAALACSSDADGKCSVLRRYGHVPNDHTLSHHLNLAMTAR